MTISVALCTYNGDKFLETQLKSIIAQTKPVDEIIICDDGSTDETINIIAEFKNKYPTTISLYKNDVPLRVIKNFEKAISLCNGDIIFLSDQDDIWKNNKVERVTDYFQNNPGYLGVFTDAELIDDSENTLNTTMWDILCFKEFAKDKMNIFKYLVFHGNVVTGACLAIKKEAKSLILPLKIITDNLHDALIALKLAENNQLGLITEPLIQYRLHSNQQTNVLKKIGRLQENEVKTSIIKGNATAHPLDYYRYWKRRMAILQDMTIEGFVVEKQLFEEIIKERKKGLMALLKTYSFTKKKRNLFKLWLSRQENITLHDCLFC